jgi:phosphatidate cytidylyltransferase
MIKRSVTSVFLIASTLISIFILPVWMFSFAASLFIALGLYEFFSLTGRKEFAREFVWTGMLSGISLPFITYYCVSRHGVSEALFFPILLITLFLIQFTRKENNNAVKSIALTLFAVLYIAWFFSFLIKIRFLNEGHKLVAYLLLVAKAGDIGAYLIGSCFGRHKLIPRISPNKSLEGAFGGFLFSMFFAVLTRNFLTYMSFSAAVFSGILIGVFAQLGDLAESLLKRDYQVKDSSPFLPGLGGVLDVIDSVIFTAPVFYIYLKLVSS